MTAFFCFCFFFTLHSFMLEGQWATTAADLNLQYISSNSTFSCNVHFLRFLGALLASLGELCTGVLVLFKVYDIALNKMKDTWGHERWLFTAIGNLPEGWVLMWRLASLGVLSGHDSWAYQQDTDRRWLQNYDRGTVCTVINLMHFMI